MSKVFGDDNVLYEDREAVEKHGRGENLYLIDGEFRLYQVKLDADENGPRGYAVDEADYRVLTAEQAKQYCHDHVYPNGTYCSLPALENCEALGIFEPQDEEQRCGEWYVLQNHGVNVTPLVKGFEFRHRGARSGEKATE